MSRKRLVSMVGGTVLSALAIGFFMQRGESAAPRNLVPSLPTPVQQSVLQPAISIVPDAVTFADPVSQPDAPNLVLASSSVPSLIAPSLPKLAYLSSPGTGTLPGGADVPADPASPRLGCDVTATATPGAMAMVDLQISAPCFINERLTIHHNGMIFTQTTDNSGKLSVNVPALSRQAVFIIAFGDGRGTVALANVPELADFDRVAVQWTGKAGFQLHAREFGAAYGAPGHVWSGLPADKRQSLGFVTRLGDSETLVPQMAEVYTFPSGVSAKAGVVALSVEAEVTAGNCGRDISAQSLELRGNSTLRTRDLEMAMPNCDAKGDFLVLNNLVDDLKIAAK
jgi:hypothetical protein